MSKQNEKLSCFNCPDRECWLSAEDPMQLICGKFRKNISYIMDLPENLAKTICVCRLETPVQLNLALDYGEDEETA